MKVRARFIVVPFLCLAAAAAAVLFVTTLHKPLALAQRKSLQTVARQYPNFTREQRMAVIRERQNDLHPKWRDASMEQVAALIARYATGATTTQAPLAGFVGNVTVISSPPGDVVGLRREGDCSLTVASATYSLSLPTVSYSIGGITSHYQQVLHTAAGLKTMGGSWPVGCGDPTLGITSRSLVPLGINKNGMYVGAAAGYNPTVGAPVVYSLSIDSLTGSNITPGIISIANASPVGAAAADFNGDGNDDVATINELQNTGGSASVSVFLANPDGTLQSPVTYPLPGTQGGSLVIDDFNGDGKLDIIASSSAFSSPTTTWSLSFLAGKGDGSFASPVSITLPSSSAAGSQYFGLISADLRNNGKKDLVSSDGVVLFGNGDGTFTVSSTAAFSPPGSTSEFGPNVVAADFNKDGKLDLAVDNGTNIQIYIGKGDGTFTYKAGYASIDNTGVLNATDLDGDGSVDLYSGTARAGVFAGDQFEIGQAYALMGNGDGSFAGAPSLPLVFTGNNFADLNGDKLIDGVGLNSTLNSTDVSFTSYLAGANNNYSTGSTLTVSPLTLGSTTYTFQTMDSYGLGDINGDGIPDLVDLPYGLVASSGGQVGYFVATGKGDGSFNTPTFVAAPSFVQSGQTDYSESLTNLWVADVNGDGKADVVYTYSDQAYGVSAYYQGVAVQLSNGDGTFQAPKGIQMTSTTAPTNPMPMVVQAGDANQDGKLDLFVMQGTRQTGGSVTEKLQLYLGKGDGTFGSAMTPPVADNLNLASFGSQVGQVVLADMNGDGKQDLITLGSTTNDDQAELAISLGNGDGTFQTPTILDFGAGSSSGYGLAAAEFDGDGKVDVAVTGFNPPFDTGVFQGNGDGTVKTFSPSAGMNTPSEAIDLLAFGAAAAMDVNHDGKPDLVAGSDVMISGASAGTGGGGGGGGGGTPDFTLGAAASTMTVTKGQSGTVTLSVTPQNGFNQAVSFSCSGLPSESTCSFSPATVTPNGTAAATTTLTVTTTAAHSALLVLPFAGGGLTLACALLFFRRRKPAFGLVCLVLLAGISGAAVGCGGHGSSGGGGGQGNPPDPGTPAGSSTVTVTATSGSGSGAITHTTTVTLTVQ